MNERTARPSNVVRDRNGARKGSAPMGFMVPVAERFAAYRVETNAGTVPEDVCGTIDVDAANASEAELAGVFDTVLRSYVEGSRIMGDIERVEGWFARLSAPGYLDCTSWDGPHATADAALAAVKELYDVDDEGDNVSDGPACGHSACRQNWIDTGDTECGVFKVATLFRADPDGDASLTPGTTGWREFLGHLRSVAWDRPEAVRVLVHDEHDMSFTLYDLNGEVAGRSPDGC